MEGMSQETETITKTTPHLAKAIGSLLSDHKGIDVVVLDLRESETWTDFFVISTATSDAHLDGLERHVRDFCREKEIEILRRSRKPSALNRRRLPENTQTREDEWRIIDLGPTVIHLMSRRARAFYDLERLFFMTGTSVPAASDHSSS